MRYAVRGPRNCVSKCIEFLHNTDELIHIIDLKIRAGVLGVKIVAILGKYRFHRKGPGARHIAFGPIPDHDRLFGFDRLEDVPANQCEAKRVKLQSVDDATFERVVTEARLGATLGAVKAAEVARG